MRTMLRDSVPGSAPAARVFARPFTSPTTSAAFVMARANDRPYVSTSFWRLPLVGSPRIPRPTLPTMRTDSVVFPARTEAKKSVVSRPRPLSLPALGSLVAKRKPKAGRDVPSDARRILAPISRSSASVVDEPVAVSRSDSGARRRLVMFNRENDAWSI